jgi:hypothetical protein
MPSMAKNVIEATVNSGQSFIYPRINRKSNENPIKDFLLFEESNLFLLILHKYEYIKLKNPKIP